LAPILLAVVDDGWAFCGEAPVDDCPTAAGGTASDAATSRPPSAARRESRAWATRGIGDMGMIDRRYGFAGRQRCQSGGRGRRPTVRACRHCSPAICGRHAPGIARGSRLALDPSCRIRIPDGRSDGRLGRSNVWPESALAAIHEIMPSGLSSIARSGRSPGIARRARRVMGPSTAGGERPRLARACSAS